MLHAVSMRHHYDLKNLNSTLLLAPQERIAEVAEILAAGLMRLAAAKSSSLSADCAESFVDIVPDQSRHANRNSGGRTR